MNHGRTYRLDLTLEQAHRCARFAGIVRAVRNAALEQRSTAWRQRRRSVGWVAQAAELKVLRREIPWTAEAPQVCLQQALRDLDTAFGKFFRGEARYPSFHRRGADASFRAPAKECGPIVRLNRHKAAFTFPKLGRLKFRCSRPLGGTQRQATISRRADAWYVSFTVETPDLHGPVRPPEPAVGLDMGVAVAVATSDGKVFQVPGATAGERRRRRLLERRLARRKKGSRRRERARQSLARLRLREANRRKDAQHKLTTAIVGWYGLVAVEALAVKQMTRSARGTPEAPGSNVAQKAGLNREILARGWGEMRRQLAYKCERRLVTFVEVDPRFTSQRCAECGAVERANRPSQATFACVACGHLDNADRNAARNILAAGRAVTARGGDAELGRPVNREPLGVSRHAA